MKKLRVNYLDGSIEIIKNVTEYGWANYGNKKSFAAFCDGSDFIRSNVESFTTHVKPNKRILKAFHPLFGDKLYNSATSLAEAKKQHLKSKPGAKEKKAWKSLPSHGTIAKRANENTIESGGDGWLFGWEFIN